MNGYLTPERLASILTLPFNLAQTELRRSKTLQVATIPLLVGQQLDLAALNLHVVKVLTPGASPVYINTSLDSVSVGLYFGSAVCCPLASVRVATVGSAMLNPYRRASISTPGVYTVLVSNNTSNLDFSVVVSGSARIYT